MTKKLTYLIIGYFIFQLAFISAGCVGSCGDLSDYKDLYKVESIDWATGRYATDTGENNDTFRFYPNTNQSINYDQYAINLTVQNLYYSSELLMPASSGAINSAYACSPAEPTSKEKITDIKIFCNKDFDNDHPAGSDISALFEITGRYNYYEDIDVNDKVSIADYLATTPTFNYGHTLILTAKPASQEKLKFTIQYSQDGIDFNYFEYTTAEIILL